MNLTQLLHIYTYSYIVDEQTEKVYNTLIFVTQILIDIYMVSNFDEKKVNIDQIKTVVESSQDSIPQMLSGEMGKANLVLLYSFGKNDCSTDALFNFSSSAGKQLTECVCVCVCVFAYV